MKYPTIAQTIINLKNKDLALRDELIKNRQLENGYHPAMAKLHNENAAALGEIIDSIGFPTIDKVGKEGNEAAWLIIQHSIAQPAFMKKCAKLLEKAVKDKQANPIQLAYLADRIAVFEDKPQLYGTQFDWDENGEMSPQSFDDLEKVNQRRQSIGLNTLEEQIIIKRERVKNENSMSPSDLQQRKMEMDKWRKSIGWIE